MILWPDQVTDQHYIYPFSVAWYAAAQVFFAVQHRGLIAGRVGLTVPLGRARAGPPAPL